MTKNLYMRDYIDNQATSQSRKKQFKHLLLVYTNQTEPWVFLLTSLILLKIICEF